jgi:hypothetical protein
MGPLFSSNSFIEEYEAEHPELAEGASSILSRAVAMAYGPASRGQVDVPMTIGLAECPDGLRDRDEDRVRARPRSFRAPDLPSAP